MSGYTKIVAYRFEINCNEYDVTRSGETMLRVEGVLKNGHEDFHPAGELVPDGDGVYSWEWETFSEYGEDGPDEIVAYINANTLPGGWE